LVKATKKKKCCECDTSGRIHNASFSSELTNGHYGLECLCLVGRTSLV
jgi:hypothetical protein